MNPELPKLRTAQGLLPTLCALLIALPLSSHAQVSAAATPAKPTPQILAKYDKNKNGVLDAAEEAAMRADEAKTAGVVATKAPIRPTR